jgi:hypothetical protein
VCGGAVERMRRFQRAQRDHLCDARRRYPLTDVLLKNAGGVLFARENDGPRAAASRVSERWPQAACPPWLPARGGEYTGETILNRGVLLCVARLCHRPPPPPSHATLMIRNTGPTPLPFSSLYPPPIKHHPLLLREQ